MSNELNANVPYHLPSGAGKALGWLESIITLKAANAGVGITEVVMHPGEEPPFHIHRNEDEWLYLLEGQMTFHVGGNDYRGAPGAFVFYPRGIAHTFTCESPSARVLVITSPGGFERMFELAPKTPEEAARAMQAFGMEAVAPHPRQLASA